MDIQALTAEQVMSRVLVTVSYEDSPLMAWELMRRAGVHHLPVLDSRRRLVGVLSREDLVSCWSSNPYQLAERKVGELLTGRRSPRVGRDRPLRQVAEIMIDAGVDALPVVTESCTLIGLVTSTDVLAAVAGRTVASRTGTATGTGDTMFTLFRLEPVLPARPAAEAR